MNNRAKVYIINSTKQKHPIAVDGSLKHLLEGLGDAGPKDRKVIFKDLTEKGEFNFKIGKQEFTMTALNLGDIKI